MKQSVSEWIGLIRSLVVYRRPGRQRGLRRLYAPFVREGDLVFDVGAHLGDRSVAFAALGARVIAFEPQPHIARLLRLLVGSSERITVREEAVGARPGTEHLAISRRTPTVSTLSGPWRKQLAQTNAGFRSVQWEESVPVSVVTLDGLIECYGMPSFCKIDVEGYEAEVLAGLSRPVAGVSVEFVAGQLDVACACVTRLQELGSYRFNVVPGERRSFAFKTWIDANAAVAWIESGADGIASGDLYAVHDVA